MVDLFKMYGLMYSFDVKSQVRIKLGALPLMLQTDLKKRPLVLISKTALSEVVQDQILLQFDHVNESLDMVNANVLDSAHAISLLADDVTDIKDQFAKKLNSIDEKLDKDKNEIKAHFSKKFNTLDEKLDTVLRLTCRALRVENPFTDKTTVPNVLNPMPPMLNQSLPEAVATFALPQFVKVVHPMPPPPKQLPLALQFNNTVPQTGGLPVVITEPQTVALSVERPGTVNENEIIVSQPNPELVCVMCGHEALSDEELSQHIDDTHQIIFDPNFIFGDSTLEVSDAKPRTKKRKIAECPNVLPAKKSSHGQRLVCDYCGKYFYSTKNLNFHFKKIHVAKL